MFLYAPRTDKQTENLISQYQEIIDYPWLGLFSLLFTHYHYRFYFITQHQDNATWQGILKWADGFEIDKVNTIGKMVLTTFIGILFTYYALLWLPYTFKVIVNYKKIRDEAPLNLLKLG